MGRLNQVRDALKNKKISLVEFYKDFLPSLQARNQKTNALLEIFEEDEILAQAKKWDAIPFDQRPSLAGLPLAIKDMISIKGKRLSAGSRMLDGYRAARSATVTEKLEAAGAVFVGRAHCDEFAMGSSNENTPFGPARNPLDLSRTPGGSSGGSAASVAAQMCVASLGTDTGGSIRLPAAFCGITGLKPTYGRVSRSGVIAFASSLDQVGPLADDAIDCAEVFEIIAGRDSRDATTFPLPVADCKRAVNEGRLKGLKIGLPKEYFSMKGMDPAIEKANQDCLDLFRKEGAELVDVSIPHTPYGIAVYYLVATAEASSNLARYDGVRFGHRAKEFSSMKDLIVQSRSEGFGDEVKRRIMLGTFALSSGYFDAYYSKAQFVRSRIQREFLNALQKCDVLFAPTSPVPAFEIGSKVKDPLQMYLLDIFTVSCNLAGVPAMAFPIGHTPSGLPIGGQFIGSPYREEKLFSATGGFEKAKPFQQRALAC